MTDRDWIVTAVVGWQARAGFLAGETRTYVMPDGVTADWDILAKPDTVAVMAVTPAGEALVVRQFRPGPGIFMDELPGGYVDGDENPVEAAARELLAETGYRGQLRLVHSTWMAAFATTRQHLVIATDCIEVDRPHLDANEFLEPVLIEIEALKSLIFSGQMTDSALGLFGLLELGLLRN